MDSPMEGYPPARIRNVALVGHTGVGKTTLAEALLHGAGVVARPGRVEDGTTVCDHEPEEVRRQTSLTMALAPFELHTDLPGVGRTTVKVNLIDTPGEADLLGEVHAALAVADLAVVVVSAVDGVQAQTEEVWDLAERLALPRMVFVNKLDRDRASFERTLDQLREAFGESIVPLELPLGVEADFSGVADVLTDTAYRYEGGEAVPTAIPAELEATEHDVHDTVVEGIVEGDDELLERYLEGDVPSLEQLESVLAARVARAAAFPVVCGAAAGGIGVDHLGRLLCEIGPSPADRSATVLAGDSTTEVTADPSGAPLLRVFRTIADPYLGHVSLFRVLSGTIRPDTHLHNARSGSDERLQHLFSLRGAEQLPVAEVAAGDIAGLARLSATSTGDLLAPRNLPVRPSGPLVPAEALLSTAVVPRSQGDEDKLTTALRRLLDEDPSLVVERVEETHQTVLRGRGETHLGVVLERLSRRFGIEVATEEERIPHRETITATAEGEGRYKKQSGGHGQFGVARIRLEPLPRGSGFEFVDAVTGGAIPRNLIPAVAKGIEEAMAAGGLHGHPVVDVRATCLDGKHHPVDSSEMSFKMAGALAFRETLPAARPVVLEPISMVTVTVPAAFLGDAIGDLNSRRGRVQAADTEGARHVVTALVPTVELTRYAIDLRSLTGGRGRFSAHHDHYDVAPDHVARRRETVAAT